MTPYRKAGGLFFPPETPFEGADVNQRKDRPCRGDPRGRLPEGDRERQAVPVETGNFLWAAGRTRS